MRCSSGGCARQAHRGSTLRLWVLCMAAVVCVDAADVLAQRRDGGAAGYGQTAGARAVPGARDGAAAQRAGGKAEPVKFPEQRTTPAGGPVAEYQKPTYDHHRFVLSPDGTKMALAGRHLEREPSAIADQPDKLKRDRSGKPIVIENVLEVIDVPTGRPLVAFKPPTMFDNLAMSPDNRFLAAETIERPGVVHVLHLPSRKSKQFDTGLRRILSGGIVFARDARSIHVLAPDRLKTIALGNGESKELKYEMASTAASYSAAADLLAVGVSRSKEGKPEVQIYDVAEATLAKQLVVPSGPTSLQFSINGQFLAATVAGGAVGVWQTSDWTRVGSVPGRIGFDPGQLAVSTDGQLVAVQPRQLGKGDSKVIDVKAGDVLQSVGTRDAFFLRSGALAVANMKGPFYLNTITGALTELPEGAALDAIGAEATAVAGQASIGPGGTGYGTTDVVGAQPPAAQTGYGAASVDAAQAATPQAGYGTAAQPAAPAGYGAAAIPSTGYGVPTTKNAPQAVPAQSDRR
jgi:hypothetical protein